jgi:hypothetical protein
MDREKVIAAMRAYEPSGPFPRTSVSVGGAQIKWMADAAIQAVMEQLREPSEAMVEAGAQFLMNPASPDAPVLLAEAMWRKMLSAFLQPPNHASEGHGHDTQEHPRAPQP